MGSLKAYIVALMSGCLGIAVGFVADRASFDPPAVETQLAALSSTPQRADSFLSSINDESPSAAPVPQNPYVCRVINPTFPPCDMGVWDPLKQAEEDIARRSSPGTDH